jgi:putative ribosome biogenesis GTPase RsgA
MKNEELTLEGRENALVLLFLGQSGVGKSFLIDLMCNNLKGRVWNASERYKITNDSLGDKVKAYSMKETSLGRPVMMIDTPGLGDVVEYQRNQEVISKIGRFLQGFNLEINAVC